MRKTLSEEGYANILANFLGQGLERLLEPEEGGRVHGVRDLPLVLTEAACNNLRIRADFADAYVVTPTPRGDQHITPEELGRRMQTHPEQLMVVFVPEEFRNVVEELDVTPFNTFQSLEAVEQQLIGRINKVPVYKRIATLWSQHAIPRMPILKRIDYLVNLISLCLESREMGMFFHKLDLIPDRDPDATGDFANRVARNVIAVTVLCDTSRPARERVAALGLEGEALTQRLTTLLEAIHEPTPPTLAAAVFAAETADPDAGLSFEHWRFAGEAGWT